MDLDLHPSTIARFVEAGCRCWCGGWVDGNRPWPRTDHDPIPLMLPALLRVGMMTVPPGTQADQL
ncbi:hypothetical protein NECAME_04818 [Necator americanus]|uniref:Uncharacterized protein n=1 Tax=Necator americanus TaxID=51031 RepID=W2SMF9_NECAM|nr:hypothetical protein NECAME_04818 [Necator americanus]ETN70805.1 hypothetical protein NECAME_04818 [Necator americanus]